jgi:Fe2+ or Zn2+ uptake regulation protein
MSIGYTRKQTDELRKSIVDLLAEQSDLRAYQIRDALAGKGHALALTTMRRQLKEMAEDGMLTRQRRKANLYPMRRYIPWHYEYNLKKS